MIQHFNNLQTPLKNIDAYPRLSDQVQRFLGAGWDFVKAKSLWDIFNDPKFVSHEERITLDKVEPFDEWEEFILFASHYFLVVAEHHLDSKLTPTLTTKDTEPLTIWSIHGAYNVRASISSKPYSGRRFAAIIEGDR